ncbi:MAG TPA: hypothetical protein VFA11_07555 [Acidimicrobiales bacterium]|nr:hypothetical protein [Acidimicrobiales bacterium]
MSPLGSETDDFGPWAPPATGELAQIFSGSPFRWWVTGGVALELHVGRSWRGHSDLDVGICRSQAPALHRWLSGRRLFVAAGGRVTPWDGRPLSAEANENNVWVRQTPDGPWIFDVAVGDRDDVEWIFRRDPAVRRPWAEAVLRSPEGVPYLAPEIQILFKSKAPRPKDHVDARTVVPTLEGHQKDWLRARLPPDHPWVALCR